MRAILPAALLAALVATPASAAERSIGIGSFDRLRVEGPFEVRVATGTSPRVTISGDAAAIERVAIRADGRTLVVRGATDGWGERPTRTGAAEAEPLVVTLSTPSLAAITSTGGGRITTGALKGDRVDLSVSGAGAILAEGAAAADVNMLVVGAGTIQITGRTTRARLTVNGPGGIDAAALDAGDVVVTVAGTGETRARARYTARVSNAGLGRVAILGAGKCTVTPATAPVTCESGR
jgi:hypothetical protein